MEYRVEKKFLLSDCELQLLESRLKTIMKPDLNQSGKAYTICSLYFDDIWDSCMAENESGVDNRSKLRIRTYDHKAQKLYLENKEKLNSYTKKTRDVISRDECIDIMHGVALPFGEKIAVNTLSAAMKSRYMRPKTIIEYERSAFVYPIGNVRITFDRNISASKYCDDFLSPQVRCQTPVLPAGMHILEVKYDEFLPDTIAQLLENGKMTQTAISKYYLGRLACEGENIY